MKIANLILLLSLGILAAPAQAQEANVPDKGNPNGMSGQDYLILREKILQQMESASPQKNQRTPEQAAKAKGKPAQDTTYGQGYGSRKDAKDTVDSKPAIESRPELPERPNIVRPERPDIVRPERP